MVKRKCTSSCVSRRYTRDLVPSITGGDVWDVSGVWPKWLNLKEKCKLSYSVIYGLKRRLSPYKQSLFKINVAVQQLKLSRKLVQAACMHCHGTKCPLLTVFFSLSPCVTFLPEGVIVGFWNFVWGLRSQEKQDLGWTKIWGTPPPPWWVDF